MGRSDVLAASPEDLATRIRSSEDREAEARLVERYAPGVRLVLARHSRDSAEAEDLFQETFRLAVSKLRAGELREPAKLAAFLASLAKNLATEHYRKAARRRTEADSEAVEVTSTVDAGQLGELLRSEEANLVHRTLEGLATQRDREILFRFYIAEEDKDRIAADHGLTNLQFNRVLHRARQRYKVLYQERLAQARAGVTGARALGVVLVVAGVAALLATLSG